MIPRGWQGSKDIFLRGKRDFLNNTSDQGKGQHRFLRHPDPHHDICGPGQREPNGTRHPNVADEPSDPGIHFPAARRLPPQPHCKVLGSDCHSLPHEEYQDAREALVGCEVGRVW